MGFSASRWYDARVYKLVALLCLVLPLTFLIIAASLHNLYSFNAADLGVPEDQLSGSAHFGAFTGCVDLDGVAPLEDGVTNVPFSIHQCVSIRPDCTVRFGVTSNGEHVEVDTDLGPNWNCSQYNAFRAFLILAILCVGASLISATLSLLYQPQSRLLLGLTVGLTSFAIVSTVVSWGLVADHWKTQNDGADYFKRGPAFPLVVTAFVLLVLGLAAYVVVWRIESGGYSKEEGGAMRHTKHVDEHTGGADDTAEASTNA